MAGAIYKPGQGYWVRVMTACFVGVLVLATALWAAEQTNRFDPPTVGYDVPLASATGEVPINSSVDLGAAGPGGQDPPQRRQHHRARPRPDRGCPRGRVG